VVIGATTIHKKLEEYLTRNYKDLEEWRITFCVLESDIVTDKPEYYKVNVEFRRKGDKYGRVALVKVDPNNGEIIEFKEGWYWKF
jgi:hypothetical protein